MKPLNFAATTAVFALLSTSCAFSDVTPEQVWQKWSDLATATGAKLSTASTARDGDSLVIKSLKITTDSDISKGQSTLAELRFRDMGDGRVEVTASDTLTLETTTPGADGGIDPTLKGSAKLPGMVTIASGTPDAMAYDFTLPSLDMQLNAEGTEGGPGKFSMTLTNGSGTYSLSGPDTALQLIGAFNSATLGMAIDARSPEGSVMATFSLADFTSKISGNFVGLEDDNVAKALAKGFALDTSFAYGAINTDVDIIDTDGPMKIIGGSQGGSGQFAMDAAKMLLATSGKNAAFTVSGGPLPFPEVTLSYAEFGTNFQMPLKVADTPADFTGLIKLVDLTVSDNIWGMLDPTAALPHDPATIILDTKGRARVTADFMDDVVKEAMGDASPFELHALNITELRAKIAGAELTGAGGFTFDNTDMATYSGMPAPTGKIDMTLTGSNTLLGKLLEMGLVDDSQAMSARLMLSMIAKAGAGEDTLTSTLEFKDKHVFANGQQLQ